MDREVGFFRAKLCIIVGRYEEGYELMKTLVHSLQITEARLSNEERDVLIVAFYCLLSHKRRIYRDLLAKRSNTFQDVIIDVRSNTRKEARIICGDMLNVLEKLLRSDSKEAKIFYTKAKADVNWSLLEFLDVNSCELVQRRAKQLYSLAEDLSRKCLHISSITRLQTIFACCMFTWIVTHDETYPRSLAMEVKTFFEEERLEQEDETVRILAYLDLFTGEIEEVVDMSWLPENAATAIMENDGIVLT